MSAKSARPEAPPPELLSVDGALARVQWRRSTRARLVSLRVDPRAGGIVITLPLRGSRKSGLDLLRAHEAWVASRLAELPDELPFAADALVPVDGVPHRIRPVPGGRGGAWIEGGEILVTGGPEFLRRRVSDCLKRLARRQLVALVADSTASAGLAARAVRIKDTRSRWGSCAPDGTLAFCWRLVMAPPHVQHYVVAHEVAHLRHMNHGAAFWALTDRLTPHRQAASAWLSANGPALLRIG
jgi:predicted metal-dependent hydrolase